MDRMNSQRSQAYGRVMKMLADIGASKLHAREVELVREAADTLLFASDVDGDLDAQGALEGVRDLAEQLVEADRWLFESADRLVHDVAECGPAATPAEALTV
jgi:hypothetical protein